jgi:phosphatidylethanolamine/phosphatidyl-N-methylethanolamine N-methyltransferase
LWRRSNFIGVLIMATLAKKLWTTFADTTLFMQAWLANPQGIGAVAPSSPKLAEAMAAWLPTDPDSFVLELGPGTGAVTDALLQRGLRQERLVAIEQDPNMSRLLREKYPRAQIITGDAWKLDDLLRRRHEPVEKVGAVISSLPLLNFPRAEAERLAEKIRTVLEPQGNWVQFTYRIHRLRPRGTTSFKLSATKVVWFNLPPARVSVFQK